MAVLLSLSILLILAIALNQIAQKRKYRKRSYLDNLEKIKQFLFELQLFADYVTWVQREQIKHKYSGVGRFFKNKTAYYKNESSVKTFNDIYNDFSGYIKSHNQKFIATEKEKLKVFFDNIEGKKLDDQQRVAIVTDEYSNLLIAGAGSGKTLTILGKLQYLIEQKNIPPAEILLLSFTSKTVDELNERISSMGLGAKAITFHKLGYEIIRKYSEVIPVVTNENTLGGLVTKYLKEGIVNDPEALQSFIQYVACYMNIPEEYDNYNSLGEKVDTEKGVDFRTLKSKCNDLNIVALPDLDTIRGEKVKSVEELVIANFLYLNGIEYDYERAYPHGEVLYRPDFYLSDYDLYLEHFGVDENNRAKWLTPFNEERYVEEMTMKRQTHTEFGTTLLETYSYYNRDNVLLSKLETMLKERGVVFKTRDAEKIYAKVTHNNVNFGTELCELIKSFINLSKSNNLNGDALKILFTSRNKNLNDFMYERQQMFLQFALPVLNKYDDFLQSKNPKEIDFNDMINKASELVKLHREDFNYKYIIIDEYQDISNSRFSLINEIRQSTGARLVCVGDDWQSIYRFAGSDISLFRQFEKYVGQHEKLFIERTYRNSQSLIEVTTKFIQKNPDQITKQPKSTKTDVKDPVRFIRYRHDELQECFINIIEHISKQFPDGSILVLGRHKFDVNDLIKLAPESKIRYIERTDKLEVVGYEHLDIKFLTVHKSKGIEADNVIILNMRNHLLGFPNKMTDDPVLSLLLNDNEEYPFAEERRLFYVALTRTKNEVFLLIPDEASLFAEELLLDNHFVLTSIDGELTQTACPYCHTGKLIIRENGANGNQFLGCSHYPSCKQTFNNISILENTLVCNGCKSGFMVTRTGVYGQFLGCTNYPKCRSTVELMET